MGVALVGDIEHQTIDGGVEDAMKGESEFDHSEVGSDVSALGGRDLDYQVANLLGELGQLAGGERLEVPRVAERVEQTWLGWFHPGGRLRFLPS